MPVSDGEANRLRQLVSVWGLTVLMLVSVSGCSWYQSGSGCNPPEWVAGFRSELMRLAPASATDVQVTGEDACDDASGPEMSFAMPGSDAAVRAAVIDRALSQGWVTSSAGCLRKEVADNMTVLDMVSGRVEGAWIVGGLRSDVPNVVGCLTDGRPSPTLNPDPPPWN